MIETIQSTAVASVSGAHTREAQAQKTEKTTEEKTENRSAAFDGTVSSSIDNDIMTISSAGAAFSDNGAPYGESSGSMSGYTEAELLQMANRIDEE